MNNSIEIKNKNHQIMAAPNHGTPLKFKFLDPKNNDDIIMNVNPVKFGSFGENSGIVKKLRRHETMDGATHSIEMLSTIPFGSEPQVARNIQFAQNHAKIITDIEIKSSLPVKKLYVDNFTLTGKITEIAVVSGKDLSVANILWQKIADLDFSETENNKFSIYNSEKPFLILLVKNSSGDIFEVGTGDDLWRWQTALSHKHIGSEFSITVDSKCNVNVERLVLDLTCDAEAKLESRNWRFKWYFAWQNGDQKTESKEELAELLNKAQLLTTAKGKKPDVITDNLIFKFTEESLIDAAFLVDEAKKTLNAPCFEAPVTLKALRKWLRSTITAADKSVKVITLICEDNALCYNASHLDRGNMEKVVHLDITSKMDFWIWANKQCLKRGLKLELKTLNNAGELINLPSLNDLGRGLELSINS